MAYNVKYCWPHIEAGFDSHRVVDIDKDAIEKYQAARLKEELRHGGVHNQPSSSYVKLGFKLLGLAAPVVAQLVEDNVASRLYPRPRV